VRDDGLPMIGFAAAITDEAMYERCALKGFELAAEPDTEILGYPADGSIFRSYNMLLDLALKRFGPDGLEFLVLVHQDAEIIDSDFIPKIREAFAAHPDAAIVGCAGALDVRSIAWWEGSVTWASYTHRFDDFGGGEIPAMAWAPERMPVYAKTGRVDSLDGFVMAFSPWAISNLRFDESIGGLLHGYDFDICMQAQAAGKQVVTAPLRVVHHHSLQLISQVDGWIVAHMTLAEKWHDQLPVVSEDWRQRARRAVAELSATRLTAGAGRLIWHQRLGQLEGLLRDYEHSISWRVTAPLRRISWWIRRRGRHRGGRREAFSYEVPGLPEPSSTSRSSSRENSGLPE
jgi:hypothetical protein